MIPIAPTAVAAHRFITEDWARSGAGVDTRGLTQTNGFRTIPRLQHLQNYPPLALPSHAESIYTRLRAPIGVEFRSRDYTRGLGVIKRTDNTFVHYVSVLRFDIDPLLVARVTNRTLSQARLHYSVQPVPPEGNPTRGCRPEIVAELYGTPMPNEFAPLSRRDLNQRGFPSVTPTGPEPQIDVTRIVESWLRPETAIRTPRLPPALMIYPLAPTSRIPWGPPSTVVTPVGRFPNQRRRDAGGRQSIWQDGENSWRYFCGGVLTDIWISVETR